MGTQKKNRNTDLHGLHGLTRRILFPPSTHKSPKRLTTDNTESTEAMYIFSSVPMCFKKSLCFSLCFEERKYSQISQIAQKLHFITYCLFSVPVCFIENLCCSLNPSAFLCVSEKKKAITDNSCLLLFSNALSPCLFVSLSPCLLVSLSLSINNDWCLWIKN